MTTLTIQKGSLAPALEDTIRTADGQPVDLAGHQVTLELRAETSPTYTGGGPATIVSASTTTVGAQQLPATELVVASTAGLNGSGWVLVNGTELVRYEGLAANRLLGTSGGAGSIPGGASVVPVGQVRYEWAPSDVDTAGEFLFRWLVDPPSGPDQPTPETRLVITDTEAPAAYAQLSDVKARAGRYAAAWSATSSPSDDDIEGFLVDIAGEIDALLSARGHSVPVTGAAAAALRGMNADGALALALDGTFPETSGPASAVDARRTARARYEKARDQLVAGTHPAVVVLEAADEDSASSFWQDEPNYSQIPPSTADLDPATTPAWVRGMPL